jgi:hypothetical protein
MSRQEMNLCAALCALVCSTPSLAQTAAETRPASNGNSQIRAQNVPVMVTWDYRAETKTLLVHATNNSGKDIDAYFISVHRKLPDGTFDKSGYSGQLSEQMLTLASIQMAADPTAYELRLQESGIGLFKAGATRDISVANIDSPDVNVAFDVAFYADGTFDEQNEDKFKRMLSRRQSQLLAMKKVNEIARAALADASNDHPTKAAITELARAAAESMAHSQDGPYDVESLEVGFLQAGISNMQIVQRMAAQNMGTHSEKDKTERERLTLFVEKQEKQVELITPQCHLEIALSQ